MSTTLTNGLKLPDKGSVDWYADMQNNYQILDGAVGTVAEHTSALAGKAPLVHTHTKSDVTDLLNSNFIPSANNSYDLGSSSYQWNNLYAKNYYYNGTEFQSKFVTTDTVQTVNGVKTFTAYVESIGSSTGDEYSSNTRTNLWLMGNRDTKEVSGVLFDTYRQNTAQGTGMHILGIGIKENRVRYEGCRWGWYWDNNLNGYTFDFKPTTQGANQALKHNLGTSVDKWNTLNGVNPGALSLPQLDYTNANKYVDISGSLTTTGSGDWYVPAVDGWVFIIVNNSPTFVNLLVFVTPNGVAPAKFIAGSGGVLEPSSNAMWCGCPAPAGSRVRIRIKDGTIEQAVFVTCQGNV